MKLNLSFKKTTDQSVTRRRTWVERFFLQHAFTVFIGSLILLFIGFLVFFYLYFYTSVSGKSTDESDTLRPVQKTVNLGQYGQIVEAHRTKTDSGKEFADGTATIPNPFTGNK